MDIYTDILDNSCSLTLLSCYCYTMFQQATDKLSIVLSLTSNWLRRILKKDVDYHPVAHQKPRSLPFTVKATCFWDDFADYTTHLRLHPGSLMVLKVGDKQ